MINEVARCAHTADALEHAATFMARTRRTRATRLARWVCRYVLVRSVRDVLHTSNPPVKLEMMNNGVDGVHRRAHLAPPPGRHPQRPAILTQLHADVVHHGQGLKAYETRALVAWIGCVPPRPHVRIGIRAHQPHVETTLQAPPQRGARAAVERGHRALSRISRRPRARRAAPPAAAAARAAGRPRTRSNSGKVWAAGRVRHRSAEPRARVAWRARHAAARYGAHGVVWGDAMRSSRGSPLPSSFWYAMACPKIPSAASNSSAGSRGSHGTSAARPRRRASATRMYSVSPGHVPAHHCGSRA